MPRGKGARKGTYATINVENLVTVVYAFRIASSYPECKGSYNVVQRKEISGDE
jgi:hypothetical protein